MGEVFHFRHYNRGTDEEQYNVPVEFARRPGFNATGKEINVAVNAYPIVQFPTKTVYQYDVSQSFEAAIQFMI